MGKDDSEYNAHINDLAKRKSGEILTSSNYTDEDALLFAELSYVKFETVIKEEDKKGLSEQQRTIKENMPLQDYCKEMIKYTDDENKKDLLKGICENPRYKNCTIGNYESVLNHTEQWAAVTVDLNDGQKKAVISMRGTDATPIGWSEDFELAFSMETDAQKSAKNYIEDYLESNEDYSVFLAGHSKGGNDIIRAFTALTKEFRDRIVRLNNFDGPGLLPEVIGENSDAYFELEDKLINYVPQDSMIGMLLYDHCKINYIYSDAESAFMEHDAHSWVINKDGKLVLTEQTTKSKLINNILDRTLMSCTQEERKNIWALIKDLGLADVIAYKDDEKKKKEALASVCMKIANYDDIEQGKKEVVIKIASTACFSALYDSWYKPAGEKIEEEREKFNSDMSILELETITLLTLMLSKDNDTEGSVGKLIDNKVLKTAQLLFDNMKETGNQLFDGLKYSLTGGGSFKTYSKEKINVNYGILSSAVTKLKEIQSKIETLDDKLDELYDCLHCWELEDKMDVAATDFDMTGSTLIQNIAANLLNSGNDWEITACSNYLNAIISQLKENEYLLNAKAGQVGAKS